MGSEASLRFELFSRDVDASVAFFLDALGFEAETQSDGYVSLRLHDVVVGLAPVEGLPASHPLSPRETSERLGLGVEIVIEVDDVNAAHERTVASGYEVAGGLRERPWGLRDYRVVSPDGYYVRVTSR